MMPFDLIIAQKLHMEWREYKKKKIMRKMLI